MFPISAFQDDMHLRVYNYNTLERMNQFEAHSDYLRSIAVHPTQPYILSSSGKLNAIFKLLFACELARIYLQKTSSLNS